MRVVIDIEANSLVKPTSIWLVVCKDIDKDTLSIFRNISADKEQRDAFLEYGKNVDCWIGHNILGYDFPILSDLIGFTWDISKCRDTLVLSRLVNYSRPKGHSLRAYGLDLGLEKGDFNDWTQYSPEMEDYCKNDVEISHRIYSHCSSILNDNSWSAAIDMEQRFQIVCNSLHNNGFSFNVQRASTLLERIGKELASLDKAILEQFPPREKVVRSFTPKATKYGTISLSSIPKSLRSKVLDYEIGKSYNLTKMVEFNPSSHKQIILVLSEAGWKPTDKTKTHIETERELNRLKYAVGNENVLDLKDKLAKLQVTGWKVNEENLSTLPSTAPLPARSLAQRILLESRRRTLTEWLGLSDTRDNRIHGKFYGIGAWTHRMAHQEPNTANIPTEGKLYGKEMRGLWCAPKGRLLVGVDAEGIQLRIFAHYINDKEFTGALLNGRKENQTDPHSLNATILGTTRERAKRFIYAYLLGAGIGKLGEILECSREEAHKALDSLLERYSGLGYLKREVIPSDAHRGYFKGLDGRRVYIPGDTVGQRKHLCMSGYLQNGEAIIMKNTWLKAEDYVRVNGGSLVNFVHDEFVIEAPEDHFICEKICRKICDSISETGKDLGLNCPLKGDGHIGKTWAEIH